MGKCVACHKLKVDCSKFFCEHRFVHCVVLCPVFTSYLFDGYPVLSLSCWLHILLVSVSYQAFLMVIRSL